MACHADLQSKPKSLGWHLKMISDKITPTFSTVLHCIAPSVEYEEVPHDRQNRNTGIAGRVVD